MPSATEVIDELTERDEVSQGFDELWEEVERELQDMETNQTAAMPDDDLEYYAAVTVRNDVLNISGATSSFGGGEVQELPILSLGFNTRDGEYFVTQGDALLGGAIVNPPNATAGPAVVAIDEAHGVDLDHAAHCFESLNTIRGHVSVRRVGSEEGEPTVKKNGKPVYVCETSDESTFEVVDPDDVDETDPISELPSGREEKRQMINENFFPESETFTLQTYADHESVRNDRGFGVAYGADMYRIRAQVQDAVVFDSGNGFLTVTDDTIYSREDINPELVNENMRTHGLQVSINEEFVCGEGSLLDIYGWVEQRDDTGQFQMTALGLIPIVEKEYEGGVVGSSDDQEEDDFEEDTI